MFVFCDIVCSIINKIYRNMYVILYFYFQEKIVSLVFGMLRKSRFNFVDVYREEAFTAVKAIVKQVSTKWNTIILDRFQICQGH